MIWFVSLRFLMSMVKGLSILFIYSKNHLLVLLIFAIDYLISFYFISAQIFMISFLLLFFFCCCSSFSSCFRCRVRLSIWCFFLFLEVDCIAVNSPLRTALAASHRFWVVLFSLSFASRNTLFSLLVSSVTCWLFRDVFFNLHVFVFLIDFFFLAIDI